MTYPILNKYINSFLNCNVITYFYTLNIEYLLTTLMNKFKLN